MLFVFEMKAANKSFPVGLDLYDVGQFKVVLLFESADEILKELKLPFQVNESYRAVRTF